MAMALAISALAVLLPAARSAHIDKMSIASGSGLGGQRLKVLGEGFATNLCAQRHPRHTLAQLRRTPGSTLLVCPDAGGHYHINH